VKVSAPCQSVVDAAATDLYALLSRHDKHPSAPLLLRHLMTAG